jgi:adenylate cyclase
LALPLPFAALREGGQDALLAAWPRPAVEVPLLVVEIDRGSLAAHGPWPWPRDRIAALVTALHEAGAAAVATDILFEAPDRAAPALLARRLAAALPGAEAAALRRRAAELPDHDATFAAALRSGRSALGFLLAPEASAPPAAPGGFALLGDPGAVEPVTAAGAVVSLPALVAAAEGHGAASLDGGRVRSVPLVVRVGEELRPGLVLEALRLATGGDSPLLVTAEPSLRLGAVPLRLDAALAVRLHGAGTGQRAARSVSAAALLAGEVPPARIADRIVLLGGAAPELGALRETAFATLLPAVQIQAEALEQVLTAWLPRRPDWLVAAEFAVAALAGLGGAAAGALLPPLALAAVGLASLLALPLGAVLLLQGTLLLADAALPLACLLLSAGIAGLAAFRATRASRARLVARFAQSLPPAIVARIAREPGLLRIGGESRRMSFVFTDIAGFTGLVERSGPARLIALLDAYIGEAAEIVARHGGTLDKVVGDALHIMFGAPLDQPDHAARAVACGIALAEHGARFSAAHRDEGFGITRVGVATGTVIVGDVGGGRVLDYTAHGDAVNLAARLEQANKLFGSSVLLDAETAAAAPATPLRRLARLAARGRNAAVEVFAPWDAPAPTAPAAAWEAAMAALERGDAEAARAGFEKVAASRPGDGPAAFHLARLARGVAGIEVDQRA